MDNLWENNDSCIEFTNRNVCCKFWCTYCMLVGVSYLLFGGRNDRCIVRRKTYVYSTVKRKEQGTGHTIPKRNVLCELLQSNYTSETWLPFLSQRTKDRLLSMIFHLASIFFLNNSTVCVIECAYVPSCFTCLPTAPNRSLPSIPIISAPIIIKY